MPWSAKQGKVFRAIEHGWNPPGNQFAGISQEKAGQMADEGVKDTGPVDLRAEHMQKMLAHTKRMHAFKLATKKKGK